MIKGKKKKPNTPSPEAHNPTSWIRYKFPSKLTWQSP